MIFRFLEQVMEKIELARPCSSRQTSYQRNRTMAELLMQWRRHEGSRNSIRLDCSLVLLWRHLDEVVVVAMGLWNGVVVRSSRYKIFVEVA